MLDCFPVSGPQRECSLELEILDCFPVSGPQRECSLEIEILCWTAFPDELSEIVKKLILIRRNTFLTATVRSDTDYIQWEDTTKEHNTMYYPNWPIWRYPKKYEVRNVTDCDFCEKDFNKHTDFSYGVFSVGCLCPLNITYGFELMLCKESAHNIFRLLMCRDINLHELQGVVFDFACGLDQYILNREPLEFQYLQLLVDGAHWQVYIFICY